MKIIIIDLIFNLALLISVSVLSGFIDTRWRRTTISGVILQGLLFGLVALLGMVNPFVLAPGIIFDGRSVVLSLCALYFGPVAGFIAACIALGYRIGLGGSGIYMGVSVIIASTVIGSTFHYPFKKGKFKVNTINLYMIGLLVHFVMIALIMAIPSSMRAITYKTLTITILGIYPVATAIIGKILKDQADSIDRIEAELALQESESRFRNLFENSLMGISETDPEGKLINANMQYAKMYGYNSPEEVMSEVKSVEDLYFNPNERDEIQGILDKTGVLEQREIEVRNRDGKRLAFIVSVREVRDHKGILLRYQGSHVDITRRKQIEEELINAKEKAEAGDRLKTAFINNISHEVRTPLNGILGFTELMRESDLSSEEKEKYSAIIRDSSLRLLNTITNYMDISMLASGTMECMIKLVDPNVLLQNLRNHYQPICALKNLGCNLKLPENNRGITLRTDADHLMKILSLLLDNAIKFTHHGEISFGYSIQSDKIEFFVTDTGTGVSQAAQDKIFEDFIQEDISNTRGYEGSGLGLSIVKGLTRLLNGEISLHSEKGAGSTFYISLPLKHLQSRISKFSGEMPLHRDRQEKQVILIAEDDESSMQYMETILQKSNYSYLKAFDGREAVEKCRNHPEISIVLMDIKMPVMDGLEATREIKSFRSSLPVIAITAYAMSSDEKRMLEAGCDGYLPKPVGKEMLIAKLEEYQLSS